MSQKKQKEQQLKPIKEFTGHSREIRCLLITSDSLYSGSYDQTIKKWDLKTGKCLWTSNAKSYLFSLASYQDIIFVCGYQIYGFLKKNGNLQIEYPTVFSQYFFTICIHDHQLFAGNQDNFLRIFLIADKKELILLSEINFDAEVLSLIIYNKKLYCGLSNGLIQERALEDNYKVLRTFSQHEQDTWGLAFYNNILYTGASDHLIKFWNLETGKQIGVWNKHENAIISISVVQGIMVSGDESGFANIWDLEANKFLQSIETGSCIWSVASNEKKLFLGCRDNKIRVYNIKNIFINNSFQEDLKQLFKRQELCDSKIITQNGEFGVHSILVEKIFNKNISEIQNLFQNKKKEESLEFFEWIYTGSPETENVELMLTDLMLDPTKLKTIKRVFSELFFEENTKDFKIIIKKKFIMVHKIVLMARSDLYRGMFLNVNDNSNMVNDYSGKSFKAIQSLIKFLYFDFLDKGVSRKIKKELFDAIDYYQLNEKSKLEEEIEKKK